MSMTDLGYLILGIIFFVIIILLTAGRLIRVAQEYQRAVKFTLGRVHRKPAGPGLYFVWPWQNVTQIDIRTQTFGIQPQECITKDNVTVTVDAVAYYMVVDPIKAVIQVNDYQQATLRIAQTTLRSVIGQVDLDTLLSHRDNVNDQIRKIIDAQTELWGIKVSLVEVKDMTLPESMQRAMAKQAEAEREKRAKIIHAQGENQAATELRAAAQIMADSPAALQLRYLQTLAEIATEHNSTIIFPMPVDILEGLRQIMAAKPPSNS